MKNVVKYLRRSAEFDVTQEQLAKSIGVSRQKIISIENGGHTTSETMMKIAEYFNRDPREIFFTDKVVYKTQNKDFI